MWLMVFYSQWDIGRNVQGELNYISRNLILPYHWQDNSRKTY